MAKQNPNDRNARAVARAKAEAAPNTFEVGDGRVLKLKKPDIMFIQMVTASVEFPDEPTYEVKVGSKTLSYPLDELVIEQTDDPLEKAKLRHKWNTYQQKMGEAYGELTKRSTAAIIVEGTEVDTTMMDEDEAWRKKMRRVGWKLPADPDDRWVMYLQTTLDDAQIASLSTAVVRQLGGVSEEQITAAEQLFRGELSTES